jgi:hypothetical protein
MRAFISDLVNSIKPLPGAFQISPVGKDTNRGSSLPAKAGPPWAVSSPLTSCTEMRKFEMHLFYLLSNFHFLFMFKK